MKREATRGNATPSTNGTEPFQTMKEVSAELSIPYWHVVRAVKAGLIPHHTLFNSKKYLRMSEVLAAVKQHGGES